MYHYYFIKFDVKLRCPALNEKRKITLYKLKQTLIQSTVQDKWTETIVGNKFDINYQ
jgi:hypothetical protein